MSSSSTGKASVLHGVKGRFTVEVWNGSYWWQGKAEPSRRQARLRLKEQAAAGNEARACFYPEKAAVGPCAVFAMLVTDMAYGGKVMRIRP